jgi:hypothetical protein
MLKILLLLASGVKERIRDREPVCGHTGVGFGVEKCPDSVGGWFKG